MPTTSKCPTCGRDDLRPEEAKGEIEILQMQIGYLAAWISMLTGQEIPAIAAEVERKCRPSRAPQHRSDAEQQ